MMKKIWTVLLVLFLICVTTTSCSDGKNAQQENDVTTQSSPPQNIIGDPDDVTLSPNSDHADGKEFSAQTGSADVDLTVLSSTMVYAEVYNMMTSPNDYVGKTVKMSGPYYAQYYEEMEQYYHFVIIEDATACCQQGIEFLWNGDHSYPDDYPADRTRIEVTGVFGIYEELGITYYHLVVDDVVVL